MKDEGKAKKDEASAEQNEADAEQHALHPSSFILHPFIRRGCVNLDAGAGNLFFDGAYDARGEVVCVDEALVGGDFKVEVYELERAGAAGAKVVEAGAAGVAEALDDGRDRVVNLRPEFPVHQHVDGVARDLERRPEYEGRDGD